MPVVALALVSVAAFGGSPSSARAGYVAATADVPLAREEQTLLQAVNEVRVAHHLRKLVLDPHLERAARYHAKTMLQTETLDHGDFMGRMSHFRVAGRIMGENLAWGVGPEGAAAAIVDEWLASPHHRANLLLPRFRRIGVGSATGTFGGYDGAVVVTVDFSGR